MEFNKERRGQDGVKEAKKVENRLDINISTYQKVFIDFGGDLTFEELPFFE